MYIGEVIRPEGLLVTKVQGKTPEELESNLGDRLSLLTYEEGVEIPSGSRIDRSTIRRIGPFSFNKKLLDSKVL